MVEFESVETYEDELRKVKNDQTVAMQKDERGTQKMSIA